MTNKWLKFLRAKTRSLVVFDWILIGCGLAAVIIFALLFFRKSSYITATVTIGEDSVVYGNFLNTGPKNWFANSFHKGQVEKDGLGRIRAEVLSVYTYDKTPTNKAVYLNVKLNTVYSRGSNTYTYNGLPVLVGSPIKLNLDNVHAEGLVTEVQGFPGQVTPQVIRLETQLGDQETNFLQTAATKSYIADAVHIGDTVKDGDGNTIIKIIDKRVVPATATITTSDGRLVTTQDPVRKDVFLTLEVTVKKVNGKYYFLTDIPVLVDRQIPVNTSVVSIFPTVTKFLSF